MPRLPPASIGIVALVLAACQSGVDPSADTPTGAGGEATSTGGSGAAGGAVGGSAGTGGVASSDCTQPRAVALPLHLLSESQFNNSVKDILRGTTVQAPGVGQSLDHITLEQRATAAAAIAAEAAKNLTQWSPCMPAASGDSAACQTQLIDKVGKQLYRRPLSESERTAMKKLFDAGAKNHGFSGGVEWLLTGMLQSPSFVYQVVRPDPAEVAGEVRPLSPLEYASRLAYFMWDGPPDDELLTAASDDQLADAGSRQAQLTRMTADPRFLRGVAQFYTQWLKLSAFREVARDVEAFDQSVVTALSTSLLMSATELYKSESPNIKSLFTGDTFYLNDVLGKFYGVNVSVADFAPTSMAGQGRSGILTHPGLMASLSRSDESFPIGRGLFVLKNVVCKLVPALPANFVPPQQPPLADGVTTRKRLETHTASAMCQGCHSMINPAGFIFESFDEVGRYRSVDHGAPVDTSATLMLGMDVDGSYATGDELLAKFGESEAVRSCFTEKYLSFAVARPNPDAADACSIQSVAKTFRGTGDLKQLVALVAESDSFRLRLAEGVGK